MTDTREIARRYIDFACCACQILFGAAIAWIGILQAPEDMRGPLSAVFCGMLTITVAIRK